MNIKNIEKLLLECYSKDLCYSKVQNDWNESNKWLGMCAITSLIINDYFGGDICKILVDGLSHYFNLVEDNLKTKYMKEVKSIYLVEFLYASTMTLIERGEKTKNVKLHIKKGEEKYLDLYKNEVIDNLPKHQRSKNIMFLRILYFLKQLVKKIR